jgi:hypothetical protein
MLRRDVLSDYLNQVEQAIIQCQNVYVERYLKMRA